VWLLLERGGQFIFIFITTKIAMRHIHQLSPITMACSCLLLSATLPLLTNGFAIPKRILSISPKAAPISSSSRSRIIASSSLHVARSEITTDLSSDKNNNNDDDNELPLTYLELVNLPRHPSNDAANNILISTEKAIRSMQKNEFYDAQIVEAAEAAAAEEGKIPIPVEQESVYANSYVDLSKVSTIGFDYDYTLVTYTQELLELIYDMALRRLVEEKEYPREMLESGLRFDPFFSIRGEWYICFVTVSIFGKER
jgi:hypothetical protein